MNNYEITFTHTEISTYVRTISAESKEEALDIFENDPFDGVDYPRETQGLDISVVSVDYGDDYDGSN